MRRFEGKTVVVTGGNRGIGLGIARRFLAEGARTLLASNDKAILQTALQLRAEGFEAQGVIADVTRPSDVAALYTEALRLYGSVDISVQNAGVITIAPFDKLSEKDWDRVLDVNCKGVFLCCQEAGRIMREQNGGRLINLSSGQGRQGYIYTPHYAASKFGVIGLTHSLAKEFAPFGVTVNAICPGIIESDMWAYNDEKWGELLGDYRKGELMRDWVKNIPLGRVGNPADVAGLAAFLASDDASYMTGQAIAVCGGLIMN